MQFQLINFLQLINFFHFSLYLQYRDNIKLKLLKFLSLIANLFFLL